MAKYINRFTEREIKALFDVIKGGKHTKETIKATRTLFRNVSDDIQQNRIGEKESFLAPKKS